MHDQIQWNNLAFFVGGAIGVLVAGGQVFRLFAKTTPEFWYARMEQFVAVGVAWSAVGLWLLVKFTPPNGLADDAPWWKYFVAGLVWMPCMCIALLPGVTSIFCIGFWIPAKLLRERVLSTEATLVSALWSFPAIYAGISVAFALVYVVMSDGGHGTLVTKVEGKVLPIGRKETVVGLSGILEVYYFSLATMVRGPQTFEPVGLCRWVALLQIIVARLLEIAIVSVGISVIVRRAWPTSPPATP